MRTFVAIELDEATRRKLSAAVERLRRAAGDVKWVDAHGAHMTLKFIGDIEDKDLPAAVAALRAAAARSRPFVMRVHGISGFPPRGRPRVIHAPAEEPTGTLLALAEAVEEALFDAISVEPEDRSFKAHVTLGRVREGKHCPSVEELSRLVGDQEFGQVEVKEIVLMKSDLTPRGPVYTPLEHIPIGNE